MSIVLALFAAVANAMATVLQRLGVESAVSGTGTSKRLMAAVMRRPIWFAGLALTTASFFLQSIALAFGNLTSVQPVMVTEIVFLVLILGTWFHQRLGWREWVGTVGSAVGLGVFLGLSYSRRGTGQPNAEDWTLLLAAAGAAVIITLIAARHGPRAFRAAAYGVSAGILFALTATFVKTVADEWQHGLAYVFSHPAAYAVAASGLVGLIIGQHALEAGPVAASQAALLIANPMSSIVIGIWLFNNHVHATGARGVVEGVSLGVMFSSLLVLAQSPLVTASHEAELLTHRRVVSDAPVGTPVP
jgi:drug/metabolite transporter (DMT)-like permease